MLDPFARFFQHCWRRARALFTMTYGLYPSHDALQELGVVASVCTPLPTCTQQLPTLLAQQCWELLRPFARSLKTNSLEKITWSKSGKQNTQTKKVYCFFPFSLPSPSPLLKLPNHVRKVLNQHCIPLIKCLPSSQDISVYPPKILFPFFTTVTVGPFSSQSA